MAPVKPPTLYIDEDPYFLEAPPIAANLPPPPWQQSPRGRAPLLYQVDLRKKNVKGPLLPSGRRRWAAAALLGRGRQNRRSPWGGTSPSSSTSFPHHPYCNLLVNIMCGTIYYFPMIYCIYVYV
jgi:hypothetical protein